MELDWLEDAWCTGIASEYRKGCITTERALQAEIFRQIRTISPEVRVFVEPGILYYEGGGPQFRPDLILCNDNTVQLVAEIKFQPHWYPNYVQDINKLASISKSGITTGFKISW